MLATYLPGHLAVGDILIYHEDAVPRVSSEDPGRASPAEPDKPPSPPPSSKGPDLAPSGGKKKRRGWIAAAVILIIVIVIASSAYLSITVNPDIPPPPEAVLPYRATYEVLIPEGQDLAIGNTDILILSTGPELTMKIGDRREEFVVGQTKTITERDALVTVLGFRVFEMTYRIDATYQGMTGDQADFFLILFTSQPVPDILIQRLLPGQIQLRPV